MDDQQRNGVSYNAVAIELTEGDHRELCFIVDEIVYGAGGVRDPDNEDPTAAIIAARGAPTMNAALKSGVLLVDDDVICSILSLRARFGALATEIFEAEQEAEDREPAEIELWICAHSGETVEEHRRRDLVDQMRSWQGMIARLDRFLERIGYQWREW